MPYRMYSTHPNPSAIFRERLSIKCHLYQSTLTFLYNVGMYVLNKKEIKEFLSISQAHPTYSLGQNYLVSLRGMTSLLHHLIPTDQIIEIGPGIGNITINYMSDFKKVVLIEIDEEKIEILKY